MRRWVENLLSKLFPFEREYVDCWCVFYRCDVEGFVRGCDLIQVLKDGEGR